MRRPLVLLLLLGAGLGLTNGRGYALGRPCDDGCKAVPDPGDPEPESVSDLWPRVLDCAARTAQAPPNPGNDREDWTHSFECGRWHDA